MLNLEFYRGKRVLVTDHTGFRRTWLSAALVQAGVEVTGYALEPPTVPSILELASMEKRMQSVIGDIRDLAYLKAIFEESKLQIVIYMAASLLSGNLIRIRYILTR